MSALKAQPNDVRTSPTHRIRYCPAVLTFSAEAWLKLQFLCHLGETEIGAFGVASDVDPLYIEEVVTVRQSCTSISVKFDDAAVAEFFDDQVDEGHTPDRFARIWLHTHPGDCPEPSGVDEHTFAEVFGRCDWAIMFILARGGNTFCRLRLSSASGHVHLSQRLSVSVDYETLVDPETLLDFNAWWEEYTANVHAEHEAWPTMGSGAAAYDPRDLDLLDEWAWQQWTEQRQREIDGERPPVPAPILQAAASVPASQGKEVRHAD